MFFTDYDLGASVVSQAQIRIAGVGASFGNAEANVVCSSGDLFCTVTRINEAAFNALTVPQLRAAYDVLLITWASDPSLNADWSTRLLPFLNAGGGVIFDGDSGNPGDLFPAVTASGSGGGSSTVTAVIPGLTGGIINSVANNHVVFTAWDPAFTPFLALGGSVTGLAGNIGNCRAVLTGPDQDYHAQRSASAGSSARNQYDLLVNEIAWVAACDSQGPITSNLLTSPLSPASVDDTLIVTATVDDTTTGNSDIASATCELTNNSTVPPTVVSCDPVIADDASFDSPTENVNTTIMAGTLTPGVYDLCMHGTDAAGNVGADECSILVIYDPSDGFVTGGGWINSPAGSLIASPLLSGNANFGFVSKYKKGASTPTGQTQFQFKTGDFNFHSSSYDWMVIAGPLAQYKGSGTVNRGGNYGFLLTAKDSAISGGPASDTFRIKIWDKDAADAVVYDNGMDQAVDGGSIVIHK
jgi:hypothetical protein